MTAADQVFVEFCTAGLWPGVGPALIQAFDEAGIRSGDDVTVGRLRTLPRVTDKRAERLLTSWIGAGQAYQLASMLVPQEIPARWVPRLLDQLGDLAAMILQADPWQLLILPDAQVAQADRLARALDPAVRRDDPRRGTALIGWTLARFARDGHTCAPRSTVAAGVRPFGIDETALPAAIAAAVAAGSVREVAAPDGSAPDGSAPDGSAPDDSARDWLSATALADAEDAVAASIERLVRTATSLVGRRSARKGGAAALQKQLEAVGADLDDVQRGAVLNAAAHGVSILTGGPGTGKSRTVSAIVELARAAELPFALAAPTGRAAKRLAELTDAEATTIHRLLGARGGPVADDERFERTADNPVPATVVVVDEASMVDAELGAALLDALADGTHLVIVGDPAQLPSIGPGRVLGDLIDSGTLPMVELRTLYRQSEGGTIARLAADVREGRLPIVNDPEREVVVVPARGSGEAAHRVVQLVTASIPQAFGSTADQIQVVTPVHRGEAGTQALNRVLKAALNPGTGTVRGFDIGDRVVATANHPEAEPVGYANGEVGTVVAAGDGAVRVAFSGGEAQIKGKPLGELLHGWAITVHRAQGSEWESVVAVLPPEAGMMLSRPLVYTALTRARVHLSVVHAAGAAVARAVAQVGEQPRRTRLGALLRAAFRE